MDSVWNVGWSTSSRQPREIESTRYYVFILAATRRSHIWSFSKLWAKVQRFRRLYTINWQGYTVELLSNTVSRKLVNRQLLFIKYLKEIKCFIAKSVTAISVASVTKIFMEHSLAIRLTTNRNSFKNMQINK